MRGDAWVVGIEMVRTVIDGAPSIGYCKRHLSIHLSLPATYNRPDGPVGVAAATSRIVKHVGLVGAASVISVVSTAPPLRVAVGAGELPVKHVLRRGQGERSCPVLSARRVLLCSAED